MIALLDPRLWVVFLIAVALAFGAGHLQGTRAESKAAALREAKANADAATMLASVTENVREKESLMVRNLNAIAMNHHKEVSYAQQKIDTLRADVRRGAVRLSIATNTSNPNAAGTDSAVATGDRAETRTELMPADADALISIAADGDRAVLRANACVTTYQKTQIELNGSVNTGAE